MGKRPYTRGFTLVELMIVVAILGILAAVAIAGYSVYIRKSRNSEATAVLADIRLKQEAYRGTFNEYANISPHCLWTPDNNPNSEPKYSWQDTMADNCSKAWRQLGAMPPDGVYFSYKVQAGSPGGDADKEYDTMNINCDQDFWYGATALEDLDDDGDFAGFVTVSNVMRIGNLTEGTMTP